MDKRSAISGLMLIWPLINFDNVGRAMSKALAASVIDKLYGSKHKLLTSVPG